MDLRPNEQQIMLRESARRFLSGKYDFAVRRSDLASRHPGLWGSIAELGWTGAALPEEVGGLGGSIVEFAILMEELGRALYVGPFLSTAVCAAMLDVTKSKRAAQIVAGVAVGDTRVALAHAEPGGRGFFDAPATKAGEANGGWVLSGRKRLVHHLASSDLVLVTARIGDETGIFAVSPDAAGSVRRDYRTIDNDTASDLELDGASAELIARGEAADDALEEGFYWMAVGLGAEATGVAEGAFQQAQDYVGVRKQFGRVLSDFQVIQHRLSDMFVSTEQLRSSLLGAMAAQEDGRIERRRAALGLKVLAGQISTSVAGDGLHLHGGMGMTDEMPISHYYRRARVIESQHGNSDYFLAVYAGLMD